MYEGYLEFGGTEIINSARAVGYMETSHCSVSWLRCPPCDGVDDAVNGGQPFIIENISQAPWYDYRAPASARFLGVHGLDIDGLPGSTREAEVAEGIMDGGVVGKPRHATRRMRVRAVLSAQGEDALEYGLSWLESALTPGRCSLHGDACGSADARLFTACPPTRESIVKPLVVWNEAVTNLAQNPSMEAAGADVAVRTNLATNPSFEQTTAATVEVRRNLATNPQGTAVVAGFGLSPRWFGSGGAGTTAVAVPITSSPVPGVTTMMRKTWTTISSLNDCAFAFNSGRVAVLPGETYTYSYWWRPSVALTVTYNKFQAQFYDVASGGTATTVSSPGNEPAPAANEWQKISYTFTVPAGQTYMDAYHLFQATAGGVVGMTFDATAALLEKVPTVSEYFDGAKAPAGDFVYAWTGAANASASIQTGIQAPAASSGTLAAGVLSSEWATNGTRSLRVIAKATSNDSASEVFSDAWLKANLKVNTRYTIMATARLSAPQTGVIQSSARGIFVHLNGTNIVTGAQAQAPNLAGVHPLRAAFTTPATLAGYNTMRLYNGTSQGNGDVWWDELLLVEGEYVGPYFDGSTPAKVRQNLASDPRATTYTVPSFAVGWQNSRWFGSSGAAGTYTLVAGAMDGPIPEITSYARKTWTAVSSAGDLGFQHGALRVTPGEVYTISCYLRGSSGYPGVAVGAQFRDAAGASVPGTQEATRTALIAGAWTRYSVTVTVPVNAAAMYPISDLDGTVPPVGFVLDGTGLLIERGSTLGTYFDGGSTSIAPLVAAWEGAPNASLSYITDPDFTYAWAGAANASASTQSAPTVANRQSVPTMKVIQSTQVATNRAHSARSMAVAPVPNDQALFYPVAEYQVEPGTYTFSMDVYVPTGSPPVKLHMQPPSSVPITYSAVSTLFDQWQRLSVTGTANATGTMFTRVRNVGVAPVGANWWFDREMLMRGDTIAYFDGETPDSDNMDVIGASVDEYEWTGAVDASTSTHRTGQVTAAPDPIAYQEIMFRLVRNLHTVTCVSGPTVEEKLHRGDAWGYIVEFVLVAAVPFLFSETKPVTLEPSTPVVIQDVPFNLVPYPSAELALGTVVATTNLVLNPSVEVNTNGWTKQGTVAADTVLSKSTELAAAGPNSAKVLFTATSAGSNGWMGVEQPVTLTGITPNMRYSVNLWSVASVQSGAAVLGNLEYHVYWQDAASATLRDDVIATLPASGGAASKKSILPPAGTTKALVRPVLRLTSWAAGDVVRLYADAAAVTVP